MADAIVGPLLTKLKDVALTEAQALARVGGEIENLSDKLMWLLALVHEADLRSRHDGSRLIRVLAFQIRDVSFEAEDAVDEFYVKGDLSRRFGLSQRFGRNWGRAAVELVVHFRTHFCVRFALSSRIQAMNVRLEEIIQNSSKYHMRQDRNGDAMTWRASRSIPLMRDYWENPATFKLIGRDDEKCHLKHMLMHDQGSGSVNNKEISHKKVNNKAILVIGAAGFGKRALLNDVFEDESIKKHFQVLVRVSFSQGTIESSTVKKIIIEKLDKACLWAKTKPQDARCLFGIHGSAIRIATWIEVVPQLQQLAGQGSKILLTHQESSDKLKNVYSNIIELSVLRREGIKDLFDHVVSLGLRKSEQATVMKHTIQDNVQRVTDGQPLAVVLLAKFMSTIPYSKWSAASEYILRNCEDDLLKTIVSVSIDDLPDELKSCLLYTAGLPDKKDIDARQLVRLWMAEGFLTQKEGLETEELGQCYLKELVYRGLLQLKHKTWSADGGCVQSVVVPDQIHPIVRLEAQRTSFMDVHYGGSIQPPTTTRRLTLVHVYSDKKLFSAPSSSLDKLRTVVSYSGNDDYTTYHKRGWEPADADDQNKPRRKNEEPIHLRKLLRESPFLRVIHLEVGLDHDDQKETKLPDEIGEMVHLQYLGVRCRLLERVPSSIGNLGRLQTLDVRGTKVKELPKSLWKVRTLRHVLGDGLIFPSSASRDLKLMQTLETVTIPIPDINIWCKDIIGRRRINKFGLRFLRRLCVVGFNGDQGDNLKKILKELNYLESLSLSAGYCFLPIDLFADASFLNNVASLELEGRLPPQGPSCDENLICGDRCLSNLTRLVLRQTMIGQDFINAIAMLLPILAELELHEHSYVGEELDLCSQRFNRLLVLRITSLFTLKRVTTLKNAVHPIFSNDMPLIDYVDHSCSLCNPTGGLANVEQHPSPKIDYVDPSCRHCNPPGGQPDVEQHPPPAAAAGNKEGTRLDNEQYRTGGEATEEATKPNYSEMILEAIKELDRCAEKTTKQNIEDYIKTKNECYTNLPKNKKLPQGKTLRNVINENLATMLESRKIIKSGWNFFIDPQQ